MLPKVLRLPPELVRRGKKMKTPLITAYLNANGRKQNRFLILVGKKTAKTAVMRHKIKRLWAEAARTLPPQSLDLTILPSPESASLGLSEIRAELKKILR